MTISYDNFPAVLPDFPADSPTKGALECIRWGYETFGDKLTYACSFGVEGSLMIHLISQVNPKAEVVFLDTGLHFEETYDVIERTRRKYPEMNIIMKQPQYTVQQQAEKYGDKLWEREPNQCCHMRKIVPLQEALQHKEAWISGLRREQSPTRAKTNYINLDHKFKLVKICPIIHWTWKDVWRYVYKHDIPYHKLHDMNYPSIGCWPCTASNADADDIRAGRWSGKGKTECGLHESE